MFRHVFVTLALGAILTCTPYVRAQSETDYYDDAVGLMGQHKYAEAEATFRKSIHADPRYKQAWQGLAEALKAEGKDASAVEKMADAAPDARAGAAPALSEEQTQALGESANGQTPADTKDAEIIALKKRLAELEQRKTPAIPPAAPEASTPPAAAPSTAAPEPSPAAAAPVEAAAVQPLTASPLVHAGPDGQAALMDAAGKPIDGVPLSKHNSDIFSPSIAVGRDGVIHVAFCEAQAVSPYAYFVYYRSSSDGGATWTEAKNLSEGLPDTGISRCQMLVDSANRAYVIWRSDFQPGTMAQTVESFNVAGNRYNLVYRVLDGGHWSKLTYISHPCDPKKQDDGMATYFAGVDPRGVVQVAWNVYQYPYHPEWFNGQPLADGRSLVFTAALNGAIPAKPREAYHCPIKKVTYNPAFQKTDDFDVIDGYFDSKGQPHWITSVLDNEVRVEGASMQLIESNRQTPILTLPGVESQVWMDRPTLLLDAKGRQHLIAMYNGGETPAVKDFLIGHTDDPTVIRAAKDVSGKIEHFQAFGTPGGEMIAIMQINDNGGMEEAETFVSTSDGGPWSPPVCVTNNKGREKFASVNTSSQSYVAQQTRHRPGEGAATVDDKGHVVLLLIDREITMTVSNAFGVNLAGGDTAKPVLRFLRF